MKELSLSMKIGEKYETMAQIKRGKFGPQLALTPAFKKVLVEWLKSKDDSWLNINIKEWGDKASSYAKVSGAPQDAYDNDAPF